MRTAVLVILIVLVFGTGFSGRPRLPLYEPRATMTTTLLAAPPVLTNGRLTWLGGVTLSGSDEAFGGFSAMSARRDGVRTHFLLLSDGGNMASFILGRDWHPRKGRFRDLPGGPRTGWDKRDRDAESLTFDARGRAWVGFESVNGIWRYAPRFKRTESQSRPPAMQHWPTNAGPETLVRWPDGRFLVLGEEAHWPGKADPSGRAGIVFYGDPTERPGDGFGFTYRPAPGFDPVDAAVLPDGDLLVLERRWMFPVRFRSRLVLLKRAALKPGAVVAGTELGRIEPPWPTENYEGVAITREGAATVVWLVSDDDQSWYRNGYLLKLRLDLPETPTARRSGRSDGPRKTGNR